MLTIKPGIYRIINAGRGTAITVSTESTNAVVGWEVHDQLGQEWLVRSTEGKYHILNTVSGQYMGAGSAKPRAAINLESSPTLWELIPAEETTWKIMYAESSFVLDLDSGENGDGIHLWYPIPENPDRTWRFEKLGDLPDDEPRPDRCEAEEKNPIIAQMLEQLAQQGKQLVELAGQLANQNQRIADQNQRIADQNQKIADQEREIVDQKRQLEEKDQQIAQANREVKYMLARVTQGEGPPHQDRVAGVDGLGMGETAQEELTSLRNKFERLEILVNQLVDKEAKKPNHMS